jgi:poly(3-hydroxybutyrate) depolymerase
MKIALLFTVAALSILNPFDVFGAELTSLSPGTNEVHFEHDGYSRRLIVTTPKTYSRQFAYPVLFCFHGAGGKADGQSERWSPQADLHGFVVICAEAIRPLAKWNFKDNFHAQEYDDVGFIVNVIEVLIENKIADENAIFATGHSSGGLFSYRLAKETDLFTAVSPMSCGMAKDAHEPDARTKPISVFQVIGDEDKSYHGSTNPKITMYSAAERIEIWRRFNQCDPDPVVVEHGDEIVVDTYACPSGVEVVLSKVKNQEHHIRRDLRDRADSIAIEFLLKHKRK